jgi:hypothetical protein
MGFECSCDHRGLGIRTGLSGGTRKRRSGAGGYGGIRGLPADWNGGFSAVRHRYGAHADARRVFAKWDASLRAVKNGDPARLLPQNLPGG